MIRVWFIDLWVLVHHRRPDDSVSLDGRHHQPQIGEFGAAPFGRRGQVHEKRVNTGTLRSESSRILIVMRLVELPLIIF